MEGVYSSDYEDIHPDILNKYHGVAGQEIRRPPGTGAGHTEDDDDLLSKVADQIEENQQSNIPHEGVKVP